MKKEIYLVWCPDYGETRDDALELLTFSSREAAELWPEKSQKEIDNSDIVQGKTVTVIVEEPDGTRSTWEVSGEYRETYWANQVIE